MYFNATALNVTNVSKVLEGVKWGKLCDILGISGSKRDELAASVPSSDQRTETAIKWWIITDPLASWMRLVDQLYSWRTGDEEHAIGDGLRHYCEELTGMCIHTTPHHE